MKQFVLGRVIQLIPTLAIISFINFVVIQLPPGDYLTSLQAQLSETGTSLAAEQLEQLRHRYGLDKSFLLQYWQWVSAFVQGDFGESFEYNLPVNELVWGRIGYTLLLSVATLLFTWITSIPIGIYSATHQYSLGDHFFTFLSFIGLAVPNFLLALGFMFVAVFYLGHSSVGGLFSPEFIDAPWSPAKFWDMLRHLWLPVVVIGTSNMAQLVRIMRGNLLDVLGQAYITTARAKGLRESVVVYKHAVRIAFNPMVSTLGMQLPLIISGETITAIVLSLPTTGPLFFRALLAQDMFLAGTFLMFLSILLVLGNFLADLGLAGLDPRIRYD